jgi:hypothetical protein
LRKCKHRHLTFTLLEGFCFLSSVYKSTVLQNSQNLINKNMIQGKSSSSSLKTFSHVELFLGWPGNQLLIYLTSSIYLVHIFLLSPRRCNFTRKVGKQWKSMAFHWISYVALHNLIFCPGTSSRFNTY